MVPGGLRLTWGGYFLSWGQPPQGLDQPALWPGRGRAVADLETGTSPGKLRQGLMAPSPAEMGTWAGGQGCGEAPRRLVRDNDGSNVQSVDRQGCSK